MDDINWSKAIDDMLEAVHIEDAVENKKVEPAVISFWVTSKEKATYLRQQTKTNKEFGKLLKKLVRMAIARAEAKDQASKNQAS